MSFICPPSTYVGASSVCSRSPYIWSVLDVNIYPASNFLVAQSPTNQLVTLGERCYLYYQRSFYAAQIEAIKEYRMSSVIVVVFIIDILKYVPMSVPYNAFENGPEGGNIRRFWWAARATHADSLQVYGTFPVVSWCFRCSLTPFMTDMDYLTSAQDAFAGICAFPSAPLKVSSLRFHCRLCEP